MKQSNADSLNHHYHQSHKKKDTLMTNIGSLCNLATRRIEGFCFNSELEARMTSASPTSSVTSMSSSSPITSAT